MSMRTVNELGYVFIACPQTPFKSGTTSGCCWNYFTIFVKCYLSRSLNRFDLVVNSANIIEELVSVFVREVSLLSVAVLTAYGDPRMLTGLITSGVNIVPPGVT